MQHLRTFHTPQPWSCRPARLLAFGIERPPATHQTPETKPDPKAESCDREAKLRDQRESRKSREAWERACEQMTDEQLLQNLGELHVKYEDGYERLHAVNQTTMPERHKLLTRQIKLIEEQLAGAREVWTDRKHVNQSADELTKETATLQERRASSRKLFDQIPKASPNYAEERLKIAVIEEQTHRAESTGRFAK